MLLSLRIALGEPNVAELIEPKCVPYERQFLDGWTDGWETRGLCNRVSRTEKQSWSRGERI
jgi:hypothetical protein